jgi:hypothetical protein
MNNYSAFEWQFFPMKKDIEKISKNVMNKDNFRLSMYIQIVLMVLSVTLPGIVDKIETKRTVYIILFSASIVALITPFIINLIQRVIEKRKISYSISIKEIIDMFDNEICYYVLMANSYFAMFCKVIKDKDSENINLIQFYYIETTYYLNKSITGLQLVHKKRDLLLSTNKDDIVTKKMIAKARYQNVYNTIKDIYDKIDEYQGKLSKLKELKDSKTLNDANITYKEILGTLEI